MGFRNDRVMIWLESLSDLAVCKRYATVNGNPAHFAFTTPLQLLPTKSVTTNVHVLLVMLMLLGMNASVLRCPETCDEHNLRLLGGYRRAHKHSLTIL